MRFLFAGGGTAGHINPAIAIAGALKERYADTEIAFVGTERGMENRLVPKEGYPIYHIDIQGFKRSICLYNVQTVMKAAKAMNKAAHIIREFQPDVVIGTGGYVSGPVVYQAARMKVPTVIHEQNAYPGMTSKMLSRVVDKVLISFDSSRSYFKDQGKLTLVGNPIRENMSRQDHMQAKRELQVSEEKPLVVCFAGSLGAEAINDVMVEIIQQHKDDHRMELIFATGERYYEQVVEKLHEVMQDRQQYGHIHVQRYIYNMDQVMAAADLLVCRSGAITISEIACLHKASILIPSPNVTGNHQYHNAKSYEDVGGAVMIQEKELTAQRLYQEIDTLLSHPEKRADIERNVQKVAYPDATQNICDEVLELARR